jgi:hypothetical protein
MGKIFQHFRKIHSLDILSWGALFATVIGTLCLYNYEFRGTPLITSFFAGIAIVLRYFLSRKKRPLYPVMLMLIVLASVTYITHVHPRLAKFVIRKRVASYHYFMGSKYFSELGYYGLYRYTLLADKESSVPRLDELKEIRHLEDLTRVSASQAIEKARKEKKKYFSEARWQEFKKDWRPMARGSETWGRKLNDHGFNPPPFWNVVPGAIAQYVNTSDKTFYMAVRLADLAIFLILLCAVAYYIGIENALLCYIFVNASVVLYYPHGFIDTYFQYQWLNSLILAMLFYRTGRMKLAGISFAYSAMVRIFPLVLMAGPGVIWLRKLIHDRRFPKKETSFLISFSVACVIFIMIGFTQGKGLDSTKQFIRNITFHADNIKFDSNKFGLKRLMSVDFTKPFERVRKEDRAGNFENNRTIYYLFWSLLVGMNIAAMYVRSDDDAWVIPLGIGLIFALMTASRYYYLMLLIFFLPDREKLNSGFAVMSAAVIFLAHGIYIFYRGGGYGGFTLGNICFLIAFLIFPLSLLLPKINYMNKQAVS